MNKRMLIDGTHTEEVRVVIADGNRLEEYDIESSAKSQLKGNIYLAKVMRVEPSLQAAFVDFGGNRHGFLAFNEIHPDYYQIPVEDREALKRDVALFEENAMAAQAHVDSIDGDVPEDEEDGDSPDDAEATEASEEIEDADDDDKAASDEDEAPEAEANAGSDTEAEAEADDSENDSGDREASAGDEEPDDADSDHSSDEESKGDEGEDNAEAEEEAAEGDDEAGKGSGKPGSRSRGRRQRGDRRDHPMRRYKIQEVIKRRQILLVQVVKEERGNKGAALTTYLSLAGRYCVLMPNTSRNGGGVSRKITNATDRRRLRDLLKNLDIPDGMGVIMRTAGMERNKSEIKRDFDYLMRLWEEIRTLTLESAAPALVYEEGDLIKRAIRDLYSREIEEVLVEGNDAYQAAKKVMRMMMPSHAKRVQPYRDDTIPLFHRYQVESLLEAMHSPIVQLKSGGYIVIDQTEALVAIDVNSGRSTRERNIEETALKTNLEAASEVALQLRLRDLAGLIVIDFIDMDESRNQRAVEKRFKEAVKSDRARIQLGRISTFGLLELSRQRMRPSLIETSSNICAHCGGTGHVRSIESMAVRVLRMIEEEGTRNRSSEISVTVPTSVALYVLNQKRPTLTAIEERCGFSVQILGDESMSMNDVQLDRVKGRQSAGTEDKTSAEEETESAGDETDTQETKPSGRRRRSRRRRRKDTAPENASENASENAKEEAGVADTETSAKPVEESAETAGIDANGDANGDASEDDESKPRRRRRGRRGGRRRTQKSDADDTQTSGDDRTAPGEEAQIADAAAADITAEDASGTESEPPDSAPSSEPERSSEIASESSPEDAPESADKDSESDEARAPEIAASAPADDAPEQKEPEGSGNPVVSDEKPEAPRRGWWQRILD